jgi:hypothetical protein
LSAAEKKFGPAQAVRPSRAETPSSATCYRLRDGRIIVFESGPLARFDGEITAITFAESAHVPFRDECAASGRRSDELRGEESIPGAMRKRFEQSTPESSCHRDARMTEWNFVTSEGEEEILSGLRAHFAQDRLQWWQVYRVGSR